MTGLPSCFVHPCRTVEAMTMLGEGRKVTLDQYIHLWLGLVGGCVGLHIPISIADDRDRVEDEPSPSRQRDLVD